MILPLHGTSFMIYFTSGDLGEEPLCLVLFMAVKIDLKKLPLYNDNIDLSFSNWYCLRVYIACLKCPSQWYDACQSTETPRVLLYPKLSVILPTVTLSTSKGNM